MAETVRVMIQMRSNSALATASFGRIAAAPRLESAAMPGVTIDPSFSPVPIPSARAGGGAGLEMTANRGGRRRAPVGGQSTYVMRASVAADAMDKFQQRMRSDPQVVGVFADPVIAPIAICPNGPMGTDADVEQLLCVDELLSRGMDGTGVRVVIVDTGMSLPHLNAHGKTPAFDPNLSWGPIAGLPLGDMPPDHGTMCAFDACIAAPACTLVDHALLQSQAPGGSVMDGFLSDAVQSYGMLLSWMTKAATPFKGDALPRTLVVNNSWGMFHPSWDFPVNDPGNYSDNPDHPFNIIVASLEAAGADILFAAGNCGDTCPDGRCQGLTNAGIFGANSSASVLSVAGVVVTGERIGYSTQGPGRLEKQKPDIASYTHFAGSGVYPADGGTSAATPVLTGVVAAVRRLYPASVLPSAQLRDLIRQTAQSPSGGFDYDYGHGVIDVVALLNALDDLNLPNAVRRSAARTVTGGFAATGVRRAAIRPGRAAAGNGNGGTESRAEASRNVAKRNAPSSILAASSRAAHRARSGSTRRRKS